MKKNFKDRVARVSQDHRTVLARILDTPNLERVVPQLQPELLHRVIQSCGLEDCGELVMLATPRQLRQILDLDLWAAQPGMDEQFNPERFGIWLEVLMEFGASAAAQKLAQMDPDLVSAGLAYHTRVFDNAANPDAIAYDVGGYRLVATRTDSWDAIVEILIALDAGHSAYFHRVMQGCRDLSNRGFEIDGLDDLLDREQQAMFDLSTDREGRRDKQGYVMPAQARAFLQMSRRVDFGARAAPAPNPIAQAYFRTLRQAASDPKEPPRSTAAPDSTAALVDLLLEAGIIPQPARALLNGWQEQTADGKTDLRRIREHMQVVFDRDPAAYVRRNEELTYLANTMMAGCSIQGKPFTAQEAGDAAVAVCNLGLENWPRLWPEANDLLVVFQAGWTILHRAVCMYAAGRLIKVLDDFRCTDRDIQSGLDSLRTQLSISYRAGTPWRARGALDVLAILDTPAWAALLGLIDEFPVLHAALTAAQNPKARSVGVSAFEFISENSQIDSIREFMQSLPEILS